LSSHGGSGNGGSINGRVRGGGNRVGSNRSAGNDSAGDIVFDSYMGNNAGNNTSMDALLLTNLAAGLGNINSPALSLGSSFGSSPSGLDGCNSPSLIASAAAAAAAAAGGESSDDSGSPNDQSEQQPPLKRSRQASNKRGASARDSDSEITADAHESYLSIEGSAGGGGGVSASSGGGGRAAAKRGPREIRSVSTPHSMGISQHLSIFPGSGGGGDCDFMSLPLGMQQSFPPLSLHHAMMLHQQAQSSASSGGSNSCGRGFDGTEVHGGNALNYTPFSQQLVEVLMKMPLYSPPGSGGSTASTPASPPPIDNSLLDSAVDADNADQNKVII